MKLFLLIMATLAGCLMAEEDVQLNSRSLIGGLVDILTDLLFGSGNAESDVNQECDYFPELTSSDNAVISLIPDILNLLLCDSGFTNKVSANADKDTSLKKGCGSKSDSNTNEVEAKEEKKAEEEEKKAKAKVAVIASVTRREKVTSTAQLNAAFGYSVQLGFESKFDFPVIHDWMTRWWKLSILFAGLYVVAVFRGRRWMKDRPKYQLRLPLFFWNAGLSIFSVCGLVRTAPELMFSLREFGFRNSVCSQTNFLYPVSGFWTWLFILSKVAELFDTAFIVLRKQPLIFLHWYHHATVLVYCFYSYHLVTSTGRWFTVMNFAVHSCMYSYYALKALSFRIPRFVSSAITLAQLAQMAVGCFVNYSAKTFKMADNDPCLVTDLNITLSFLMYASYFVLFARFFYVAYFSKRSTDKPGYEEKKIL